MKVTKSQLKQIIKEELATISEGDTDLRDYGVEEDPRSPQEHQQEDLNDILKRLSDPEQREHVKAALEQSGVLELDPIKNKKSNTIYYERTSSACRWSVGQHIGYNSG